MNPYLLYTAWGVCLAGGAVWAGLLLADPKQRKTRMGLIALWTPLISAVISLFTFVCFTLVFIVGRSSNVAQLAQPDGIKWWSFWFDVWPFALLSNMALGAVSAIFLFVPPYPLRHWQSSICRLVVCLGIGLSLYFTIVAAPDA